MTDQEARDLANTVAVEVMEWSETPTLFNPVRDIEDAFEVVSRMAELGYSLDLRCYKRISMANFHPHNDPEYTFAQQGKDFIRSNGRTYYTVSTPAEAIVHAALVAISEGREDDVKTREIDRLMKKGFLTAAELNRVIERESDVQAQILDALEFLGYTVQVTSERRHGPGGGHGQTKGIADLLVRRSDQNPWPVGVWTQLEVKTSTGALTPEQCESEKADGLIVVRSAEEAIRALVQVDLELQRMGWAARNKANPRMEVTVREL